ncbi:MAG: DUF4783 domain-containing protein [Anditalea sp.]
MNKMNALIIYYFGILFLLSSTVLAIAPSTDEIAQAIQSGSSRKLAEHFNNTIALKINNPSSDYSKNQAELIFRDFFKKFPPKNFQILHQGESSENLWYLIGNYLSEEADFKVLVKGKWENGIVSIYSIEISRE